MFVVSSELGDNEKKVVEWEFVSHAPGRAELGGDRRMLKIANFVLIVVIGCFGYWVV